MSENKIKMISRSKQIYLGIYFIKNYSKYPNFISISPNYKILPLEKYILDKIGKEIKEKSTICLFSKGILGIEKQIELSGYTEENAEEAKKYLENILNNYKYKIKKEENNERMKIFIIGNKEMYREIYEKIFDYKKLDINKYTIYFASNGNITAAIVIIKINKINNGINALNYFEINIMQILYLKGHEESIFYIFQKIFSITNHFISKSYIAYRSSLCLKKFIIR